ncbi:MAG: hypothetical protein IKQ31_03615 [Clostridia bacterium]|nr:hypothetical protein [Clostridia bacterium]
MKKLVDIKKYKHKDLFERFIKEQNPAVCVTGCFDVTNLYKRKDKHRFNAMMCYCVVKAAQGIEEFHYSIGANKKLYYYPNVKTNFGVKEKDGIPYWGDVVYADSFAKFEQDYEKAREYCYQNCKYYQVDNGALISTSAVTNYPFTSFSIDNSDEFWDTFLMWGRYVEDNKRVKLNISMRFHHAILDGEHVGLFFAALQNEIDSFKV